MLERLRKGDVTEDSEEQVVASEQSQADKQAKQEDQKEENQNSEKNDQEILPIDLD